MSNKKVASTGTPLTSASAVATSGSILAKAPPKAPGRPLSEAKIESAVYSYIQAMRAVGKTRLSTAEIATALGLPHTAVKNAAARLSSKGVRAAE